VFKVSQNFQGAGRIRLWLLVDNILLLRLEGIFIDAANPFLPRQSKHYNITLATDVHRGVKASGLVMVTHGSSFLVECEFPNWHK
jgi:hypothetical protein